MDIMHTDERVRIESNDGANGMTGTVVDLNDQVATVSLDQYAARIIVPVANLRKRK